MGIRASTCLTPDSKLEFFYVNLTTRITTRDSQPTALVQQNSGSVHVTCIHINQHHPTTHTPQWLVFCTTTCIWPFSNEQSTTLQQKQKLPVAIGTTMISLSRYLLLSSIGASIVAYHAFSTRQQYVLPCWSMPFLCLRYPSRTALHHHRFFPAVFYMATSKLSMAVMGNMCFAIALLCYRLIVKVCIGVYTHDAWMFTPSSPPPKPLVCVPQQRSCFWAPCVRQKLR